MKRYNLEETGVPYEMSDRILEEDPEGEWVKWEDMKHLIEVSDSREKLIELMCPFLEKKL